MCGTHRGTDPVTGIRLVLACPESFSHLTDDARNDEESMSVTLCSSLMKRSTCSRPSELERLQRDLVAVGMSEDSVAAVDNNTAMTASGQAIQRTHTTRPLTFMET